MRRYVASAIPYIATIIMTAWTDTSAWAQEKSSIDDAQPSAQAGAVDLKSHGLLIVRATDINGTNVHNPQGEDIGEIEDIVIDFSTSKVTHAIISFGGFLGIGDKLFAVPFSSLSLKRDVGSNSRYFETNLDRATLEQAPGFDKSHWPNFSDPNWSRSNDQFYTGADRQARRDKSQ